jgi:predicted protein tyrosine phosphatase
MAEYTVTWVIDVEADSEVEAAQTALRIQRDVNSWSTVFTVNKRDHQRHVKIDLADVDTA